MSLVSSVMIGCSSEKNSILKKCLSNYDEQMGRGGNNWKVIYFEGGTKSRGVFKIGGHINYFDKDLMLEILRNNGIFDGEYGYLFCHTEDYPAQLFTS